MKGTVEPIREWDNIQKIKEYFFNRKQYRDWIMFTLGLNLALRISDLLQLKISDIFDFEMYPKNRIALREKKTGKENLIYINISSHNALLEYVNLTRLKYSHDYLFRSRQGDNNPISRIQAYRILVNTAKEVGLGDVNIGTHSLRKSWGYHAFKRFNLSLDEIMLKLNHQSISSTKHYVGLSDDEKKVIENHVSF